MLFDKALLAQRGIPADTAAYVTRVSDGSAKDLAVAPAFPPLSTIAKNSVGLGVSVDVGVAGHS